jgi:PKD repeat protein
VVRGLIDVGNQTTYLLSGLRSGQLYYLAVTAYDTSGNQSTLSNQASATTPTPPRPPEASFTATPTTVSALLAVSFTNTSMGQTTTWAWTFRDNTGSSAQHPQHTYANAGS